MPNKDNSIIVYRSKREQMADEYFSDNPEVFLYIGGVVAFIVFLAWANEKFRYWRSSKRLEERGRNWWNKNK